MAGNDYHLVSHWRVQARIEEVSEILNDAAGLPFWWGSVYRAVELIDPGDDHGNGKVFAVEAQGWLPYTLRLQFRQTEQRAPHGFTVSVAGDLNGTGVWTFEQNGVDAAVTFDWRVRADKPVLQRFSFLLKPLFASNHHWTMRRGEEALSIELSRRHAQTPEEHGLVPEPPAPFRPAARFLLLGTIPVIATIGTLVYRLLRVPRRRS